jgi:hypothetical protein
VAVSIKDNRTTINDAQATTNWTGAGYGTTTVSAEDTLAVAESLATTSGQIYYTDATSRNLGTSPGTLVYIWTFNNALQDAWDASPPPNALLLGDGTDRIGFDMAGADRRVFNHLEGPSGLDVNSWQCLVLDTGQAGTMNSAGNTYVVAGSYAALNFAAITQFGASFDTNSKALGGGYNVAVDIIRFGNDGIDVQGGTTGARGTFTELATADRSRSADAAHGIFRAYSPPTAFGCQGPMSFGDNDGTTTTYFEDSNAVVIFEDRNIGNDKYYINIIGNSTGTNHFKLTGCTITSAGPHVSWDSNGGNVNLMEMDGCTFRDWGDRAIVFSSQADATGHHVNDHIFDNCGTITGGDHDMLRMTIQNPANTSRAFICGAGDYTGMTLSGYEGTANTSAILFNEATDPDGELDELNVTMGTALTHAIEFGTSSPLTMTLRDCTFTGFNTTTDNANDSTFHIKRTTSTVTINIAGNGTAPGNLTYRTDGATVVIQQSVTLTVNVDDESSNPINLARVRIEELDGTLISNGSTNASGVYTDSYNYTSDTDVRIIVRKSSSADDPRYLQTVATNQITSVGMTQNIILIEDSIAG